MGIKLHKYLMAPIVLAGISLGWQAQAEVINFEGFDEGAIVGIVTGSGGSGPILVEGFNPDFPTENRAVIFDSSCPPGGISTDCSGEDIDLGTPNEDFGGPGIGIGGNIGSAFENDTAQGKVLIIAEDLVDVVAPFGFVDDPDDDAEIGASFSFDFTALFGAVTVESITLIDVDGTEPNTDVSFFDEFMTPIGVGPFVLPVVGDNGKVDFDLGPTSGVRFMEVTLNGSGAIDNIVFNLGEGCTPGYWKQPHHFNFWISPYDFMPSEPFSVPFEDAFPGKTLLQVLKQGGGGLKALGRHTVAALLNAASSGVDYGLTVDEVIGLFNDVHSVSATKQDYNDLKNQFESLNELGCPLN